MMLPLLLLAATTASPTPTPNPITGIHLCGTIGANPPTFVYCDADGQPIFNLIFQQPPAPQPIPTIQPAQ